MIIALNNLAPGGTLMLTVNCNGNVINCSTICLLRCLFARAHSAKVRVMHAHRGTFRMVFQGYDPALERQHGVLDQLCAVLDTLKAQTRVDCLDVPGTTSVAEMVDRFGANVQRLYEPVWAVQLEALKRRFPGTFGLSAGRPHGRGFREQPGRGPSSSRYQNGAGRGGESGERRGYEDGHRDGASSDRWGRQEAGPSKTSAGGRGQSDRDGHWGRGGANGHVNGDDRSGRIGDDAQRSGDPLIKDGATGPRKGTYVPPHARNSAVRGECFGGKPNRTNDSRW